MNHQDQPTRSNPGTEGKLTASATVRVTDIIWSAPPFYVPFAHAIKESDSSPITVCLLGRGTVQRYAINRGSTLRLHKGLYVLESTPSPFGPADIMFAPSRYDQWKAFRLLEKHVSRRRLLLMFQNGIQTTEQLRAWCSDPQRKAVPGIGYQTVATLRQIVQRDL